MNTQTKLELDEYFKFSIFKEILTKVFNNLSNDKSFMKFIIEKYKLDDYDYVDILGFDDVGLKINVSTTIQNCNMGNVDHSIPYNEVLSHLRSYYLDDYIDEDDEIKMKNKVDTLFKCLIE